MRPASFRTGPAEWIGEWIARDRRDDPGGPAPSADMDPDPVLGMDPSACPHLRREFELAAPVRRATLYATARGVVELQLNGARIGDAVLAPGWTDYRRRIEYAAYDVGALLREGDNVLGAILGDGWFAGYVGFDAKRRGAHYGRLGRARHRPGPRHTIPSSVERNHLGTTSSGRTAVVPPST